MTRLIEAARKFVKNAMGVMSGVLFVIFLAVVFAPINRGALARWNWADPELRGLLTFGMALLTAVILFGLCSYGLVTKRWWATHGSLILTVWFVGWVVLDPSVMHTSLSPVFLLMIGALPSAMILEIVLILGWRKHRRQQA